MKVPEPPDQIPVVVGPETTPDKAVLILFAQVNKSNPALTAGAFVKVILTVSFTRLQAALFVDVKYKFAKPAVNSAALGV